MIELPYEHRMRLKFNQYSIGNSFKKLKQAIDTRDNQELYTAMGELLLWVVTTDEWYIQRGLADYKKRRDKSENGVILLGMRHAFNMFKHNMSFFQIHQKNGGITFPLSFSVQFKEIKITWMPAGDILNGEYPNQKENYIKYLEGKEVIDTFTKVVGFLNYEFQKVIF